MVKRNRIIRFVVLVLGALYFVVRAMQVGALSWIILAAVVVTLINLRAVKVCDACGAFIARKFTWEAPRQCTRCGHYRNVRT